MRIVKNGYFDRFICIAQNCPDSCCKEWEVQVDEASYQRYQTLSGPLGCQLRQILRTQDGEHYLTVQEGRCPMWREDGLCLIQAELGEEALCNTCRAFPRLTHDYGDFREYTLELSCPEAARLLLTQAWPASAESYAPGGEAPEYDREDMALLLRTRQEMLALLDSRRSVGEVLTLMLLYGYHVQGILDGAGDAPFDPEGALETAAELAKPGDFRAVLQFYSGLEILTQQWADRLQNPQPGSWSEPLRNLAKYGVERYWLQAVSDYDLVGRVKMVVLSCLVVRLLGGDPVQTAQAYSKEIENNTENIEAILEGIYTHPALTDDQLLWLLKK